MKTANFDISSAAEIIEIYDKVNYAEASVIAIRLHMIYGNGPKFDQFIYDRYPLIADAHKLNLAEQALNEVSAESFNFSCAVEEIVEPVKEPELTPEEIAKEELEMDETYEKIWSTLQAMHDNYNDPCSLLVA